MPEAKIRNEIDTDEDTYWEKCFVDEAFNKKLFLEGLKFPNWKLLEQKDDGEKLVRRVQVDPPVGNLPGAVKKVIGDRLSYTEEGTFDRKAKKYTFRVIPSTMAEKTKVTGEMWCEKLGEKKIARHVRMSVEVKVFMVGGMVEERILDDLRTSYDKGTAFTNQYLKDNGFSA